VVRNSLAKANRNQVIIFDWGKIGLKRFVGTRGLVSQLAWLDGDAGQRTVSGGLTDIRPFFFFNLNTRSLLVSLP
jgi:hypothetical protein